jgi:hypothetical protein
LNEKGQNALEIIAIATVLLGMLLAVSIIIFQMNADTERLSGVQGDTVRCEAIASSITGFNSNKGYSQSFLESLDKQALVRNGSVTFGNLGCRYSGNAFLQVTGADYEDDEAGFLLAQGVKYKMKKNLEGTVFCDVEETWC